MCGCADKCITVIDCELLQLRTDFAINKINVLLIFVKVGFVFIFALFKGALSTNNTTEHLSY